MNTGTEWAANMETGTYCIGNIDKCKGKKALIVDEFGLGSTENLSDWWNIRESDLSEDWYGVSADQTWRRLVLPMKAERLSIHSYTGLFCRVCVWWSQMLDILRTEGYLIRGIAALKLKTCSCSCSFANGKDLPGEVCRAHFIPLNVPNRKKTMENTCYRIGWFVLADVVKFEYSPEAAEPLVLYTDESKTTGTIITIG